MPRKSDLTKQLAKLQADSKRLSQYEKAFDKILQSRFNATSKEIDNALAYYASHMQNSRE